MQDLHQDLAALFMHGARDAAVVDDVADEIQSAAQRQQPALAVRRDAAGDDQPDLAGRALGYKVASLPQS
jgi:hypothetical protein